MQKKSENIRGKSMQDSEVQLALVENFINLQKVLTNLTVKFEVLSDNISKLLQLFEISAKNFIKKTEEGVPGEKDMLSKLDTILEQNKLLARGITLIEEKTRHRLYGESPGFHIPSQESHLTHQAHVEEHHPTHHVASPQHQIEHHQAERPRPKHLPRP